MPFPVANCYNIGYSPASSNVYGIQQTTPDDTEQKSQHSQDPVVEVITPDVHSNSGADGSRDPFSGIWSRTLRIKITARDGFEKLDVRIPVSYISLLLLQYNFASSISMGTLSLLLCVAL